MFSIGEFSRATGLTVKALRFYHDQGLLIPAHVDSGSGYRYYVESQLDLANVIMRMRELDFSVKEIASIVGEFDDEGDILEILERRMEEIATQLNHLKGIRKSIEAIVAREREAKKMIQQSTFEVVQKRVEPIQVAGVRMQGRYSDCGKGFAKIGRKFGRHICGKPLLLLFDREYKEEGADFEACMPVRRG